MKRLSGLLIVLICFTRVYSQNPGVNNNLSIGIGLGMSGMAENAGISLYFDFNVIRNRIGIEKNQGAGFVYGARYISISTIGSENESGLRIWGGDFLIGLSVGKVVSFRLLTGVGMTGDINTYQTASGNPPHPYWVHEKFTSFDLPIQAGLYLNPSEYFGLGITGFVSLNFNHRFSGVNVSIVFGKLR
jgi:hypothetical protein